MIRTAKELTAMVLYTFKRCKTCKNAKEWLKENGFEFTEKDLEFNFPSEEELRELIKKSGRDAEYFSNTTGHLFIAAGLKHDFPTMTEDERIHIISVDGQLIRRPLLIDGDTILAGFSKRAWEKALLR